MSWLDAIILGLIEGITEFLPISSTGHLILASHLLKLESTTFLTSFQIAIQLGAILAVVVLYGRRLINNPTLISKVLMAFIPTAVIGLALYQVIKTFLLTKSVVVAVALGFGGVFIIAFEAWYKRRPGAKRGVESLSYQDAFWLGLAQSVSIIPGISRAAATILGGLALGLTRTAVVEFSFLLAIPTMAAATAYDLYRSASSFSSSDFVALAIGFVVAFFSAVVAIRWLLKFIQTHDFTAFGVYRILVALAVWWFLLA